MTMGISNVTTLDQLIQTNMNNAFDERTLWDIIKGCVATLIACTWVSVHPNMTAPTDTNLRTVLVRLELMIWSLLVPEMVIFWALRQWMGAYGLSKHYRSPHIQPFKCFNQLISSIGFGWKLVHGFFAQMGGFVVKTRTGKTKVLLPDQLALIHIHAKTDFPQVPSAEIYDRSKGDGFSKVLVLGQTTWFIAQCIGRHIRGLSITQLEILTVSFCALNGVMYLLWWEKPLNARVPIEVRIYNGPDEPCHINPHTVTFNSEKSVSIQFRDVDLQSMLSMSTHVEQERSMEEIEMPGLPSDMGNAIQDKMPLKRAIFFPYRRLREMMDPSLYNMNIEEYTRVPIYYAYAMNNQPRMSDFILFHVIVLILSSGFGAIHLAAWNTAFATGVEIKLWRGATLTIIAAPLLYGLPAIVMTILVLSEWALRSPVHTTWRTTAIQRLTPIVGISKYIVPAIYIIARLILLVEAFISLRQLPSSAFLTMSWTKYVPHI